MVLEGYGIKGGNRNMSVLERMMPVLQRTMSVYKRLSV